MSEFQSFTEKLGFDNYRLESSPTNPYFNFYNHKGSQELKAKRLRHKIHTVGVEILYIKREKVDFDNFYGEDPLSNFSESFPTAVYVNNAEFYTGDGEQINSFGYFVQNDLEMTTEVGLFELHTGMKQPKEGDLIYFKLGNALFEIKQINPYQSFYDKGSSPLIRIHATKFNYSTESVNIESASPMNFGIDDLTIESLDSIIDQADFINSTGDNDELEETKVDIEYDEDDNPFGSLDFES